MKGSFEWIQTQLAEKGINIFEEWQLASGYYFLELVHKFHPRVVDLKQAYMSKEANNFMILQNYKALSKAFVSLGWKRISPERYVRKNEQDYSALASFLHRYLTPNQVGDKQPALLLDSNTNDKPKRPLHSINQTAQLQKKKYHLFKVFKQIQDILQEKHLTSYQSQSEHINLVKQRLQILIKSAGL